MSIIETQLSARLAPGLSVIPARMTDIAQLRNGSEYRNARWSQPRRRFVLQYKRIPSDAEDELLNLWMACEGPTYGFLIKDRSDYSVTTQSLGNAPSGSTAVQLIKTYSFGSGPTARTHTRTITRPLSTGFTLHQDGIAKAGTLDVTTGLFTPTTSWSAGLPLTWTGEFLVPVRFASDEPEWMLPFRELAEISVELIEVIGE